MLWVVMTLAVAQPVEFNGRLSQTVVFEGRLSKIGGDPRLSGHDAAFPPGHDAPAPQVGSLLPAETASNGSPAGRTDKPAAQTPTHAPPASSTAVCQCRGNDANRAVCFCVQNRVQCHCSREVGSVWRVEGGKAVAKTGQKANPNQAAFDAEWERRVERNSKARQDAQEAPEPPVEVEAVQGTELWFYTQRSCVPCRALEPILKRLEADGLTVHRIDCSRGAPTRRVAGKDVAVSVTPTIVIGRDSKWVATLQGPVSESRLRSALGL